MMTIEAWLALAATATVALLIPHPLGAWIAELSLSKGKLRALLAVAALVGAMAALASVVAAFAMVIAVALSGVLPALAWMGVAYLMLYTLHAYQDARSLRAAADNDNAPKMGPAGFVAYAFLGAFGKLRYLILVATIFIQFIDTTSGGDQYLSMVASLATAAAASGVFQALFPRLYPRRNKRNAVNGGASRKPKTVFIARRAVTAGYRRIAA